MAQLKEIEWNHTSSIFSFHSGIQQTAWCPPTLLKVDLITHILKHMLMSSRNILIDPLRNHVSPTVWASLSPTPWHIVLTITCMNRFCGREQGTRPGCVMQGDRAVRMRLSLPLNFCQQQPGGYMNYEWLCSVA